jgi:hypothetical protein
VPAIRVDLHRAIFMGLKDRNATGLHALHHRRRRMTMSIVASGADDDGGRQQRIEPHIAGGMATAMVCRFENTQRGVSLSRHPRRHLALGVRTDVAWQHDRRLAHAQLEDDRIVVTHAAPLPVWCWWMPDTDDRGAMDLGLAESGSTPRYSVHARPLAQLGEWSVPDHRNAFAKLAWLEALHDCGCTADMIRVTVRQEQRAKPVHTECPQRGRQHASTYVETRAGRGARRVHEQRPAIGEANERCITLAHVEDRNTQPGGLAGRVWGGGLTAGRGGQSEGGNPGWRAGSQQQRERDEPYGRPQATGALRGPQAPPARAHDDREPERGRSDALTHPRRGLHGSRALENGPCGPRRQARGCVRHEGMHEREHYSRHPGHLHHTDERHGD